MNQTVRTFRTVAASRSKWGAVLVCSSVVVSGLCLVAAAPATSNAAAAVTVDLGSAASFVVLAGAAATVPGSFIPGEVGSATAITPNASTQFGSIVHTVNDPATMAALADATTAYAALQALPVTGTLSSDDLAAQVIVPGVYRVAAYAMTTPATFDATGDPNAFFIMQSDTALNTTAGTTMNLINGAQANHIFWVITTAATLGASSTFYGTMISGAAITIGATSTICGRALSVIAAVTLDADTFCALPPLMAPAAAPTIAIDGGPTATTNTSTPHISGTSSAPAGSTVTVTVAGQPLTTRVTSTGIWLVVPTQLTNGTPTVHATVTDSLGRTASATQSLTVFAPSAPTIISGSIPVLNVGVPATTTLTANGNPVPTYAATAGGLPSGMTLDANTGVIAGTPTISGAYSFKITASNSAGSASKTFSGALAECVRR